MTVKDLSSPLPEIHKKILFKIAASELKYFQVS